MAIAKLCCLKLAGVAYERDAILDALQRTGVVDVTEEESVVSVMTSSEVVRARQTVEALTDVVTHLDKATKAKEPLSPYCDVTYETFMDILSRESELSMVIDTVEKLVAERASNATRRARLALEKAHIEPYLSFDAPFSTAVDTPNVKVILGQVSSESYRSFTMRMEELELCKFRCLSVGTQSNAVLIVAHSSVRSEVERVCMESSFTPCSFHDALTPQEMLLKIQTEVSSLADADAVISERMYAYKSVIADLKVLADRYTYMAEKARLSLGFQTTTTTFTLLAFVPKEWEERVRAEVNHVTDAVYLEFSEPSKDAQVPTLMRNKGVVKPFEFVTNMFSPPAYRERDPNLVMGIFFMLFFGFIMSDMGYGILLAIGGLTWGLLSRKDSGSRSLKLLIGMGGIFAVIFGALFGSLFGYTIFPAVMPNPETEAEIMLVYCLAAGVVQILVGFIMKGVAAADKGTVLDGILDGYIWALFCVGILLALPSVGASLFNANLGFVFPDAVTYTGYALAGGVIVLAMLTAGRHTKGVGKFTKGFGAAYGIINFFSDVLSYARLFGLMLSGAIVSRIVTDMSIEMMTSVGGIIMGVVILIIGHAFNLAMNVLGAYVHDARLQYIEYFSRFYEGEGTLFCPIGTRFNYITLKK